MQVIEIYVELGQTRSINFQSHNNRVGLRASLDAGEDPVASVRELQEQAHELLLKNIPPNGATSEPS